MYDAVHVPIDSPTFRPGNPSVPPNGNQALYGASALAAPARIVLVNQNRRVHWKPQQLQELPVAPYSSHGVAIARMPSLKFSSLIHSLGACAFSPGNPNPTNSTGAPSIRSKSPTTGMEPPSPVITGSFPNAARNALRAAS